MAARSTSSMLACFALCFCLSLGLLCVLYPYSLSARTYNINNGPIVTNNRIACVYAYYEKNDSYKRNFTYFLNHGILDHVDYYIVINGYCSVDLSRVPMNMSVCSRENVGYDFGAWGHALDQYDIMDTYDYVAFMNTSVKGPFLRKKFKDNWTRPFLDRFKASDETMLVGTSINVYNLGAHVQSMMFMIRKESLCHAYHQGIFWVSEDMSFWEVIVNHEIRLSRVIFENGFNIDCLLSKYQGIDYRKITKDFNPSSRDGDPYHVGAYFGKTIDPYEVVFFKLQPERIPSPSLDALV